MARRKKVNKAVDRKIFEVTANRIHKKNLDTIYAKGGQRF